LAFRGRRVSKAILSSVLARDAFFLPILSPLAAAYAATPLAALLKADVKVHFDDLVIQRAAIQQLYGVFSALSGHEFHKTEPTWCQLETIETHDHTLDLTSHAKNLIYLFLRRVNGQVSHVYCLRFQQLFLALFICANVLTISVG
jgi:hypothetical protein